MNSETASITKIDLVLIDDDPLVRECWALGAEELGYSLLALAHPDELNRYQIDHALPIFMDLNLGVRERQEGQFSGIEHLDRLHERGHQRLFMATGTVSSLIPSRSYLSGVIGKQFPEPAMIDGDISNKSGGKP